MRRAMPQQLQFELFWLRYQETGIRMASIWQEGMQGREEIWHSFERKRLQLLKELRAWHSQNYEKIEEQLMNCKKTILLFDKIEEKRNLDLREFSLRNKVRERAYELASIKESRWKQRSRCKWLAKGDKNTRFFQAYASARSRKNVVTSLLHEGTVLNTEADIRQCFFTHMQSIIGSEGNTVEFNPGLLYTKQQDLTALQAPFTKEEVEMRSTFWQKTKRPDPMAYLMNFYKFMVAG